MPRRLSEAASSRPVNCNSGPPAAFAWAATPVIETSEPPGSNANA